MDLGTAPPTEFANDLDAHIRLLSTGVDAVSGGYAERLAIRTDYILSKRINAYYHLIKDFIGVDTLATR